MVPPLDGRLGLAPDDTGAVLSGLIISQKENWIINRAIVHVRITETRHCGEKLNNMFSDSEWDKHCAENPNYSLAYLQAANCNAKTLLAFDPAKQHFDFFFSSVRGHPEDLLGVFK